MKKRLIPILFLLSSGLATPIALMAQGSGAAVKVTSTLHSDGTTTILRTDPDAGTAESTLVDAAQKVMQRTVYTLDEQGQFASANLFDGSGKLLFKSVYHRDARNRLSEQIDSTADDKPLRTLRFEYDSAGKLVKVRTFDPAGNETTPAAKKTSPGTRRQQQR